MVGVILYGKNREPYIINFPELEQNVNIVTTPAPVPTPAPVIIVTPPQPTPSPVLAPYMGYEQSMPEPSSAPAPFEGTPPITPPIPIIVEPIIPKTNEGRVWINENTYVVGGNGEPIILVDSNSSHNLSYAQLKTFLRNDQTEERPYSELWVCADFAETLHNNAEAVGIKSAFVAVTGVVHAFNAFQTTDEGLVFVDSTGVIIRGDTESLDTIAYLQVGKPLGFISLENAEYYGFQYSSYGEWRREKVIYETMLEEYNSQLDGRTIVPEDEYYEKILRRAGLTKQQAIKALTWVD